MSSRDRAGALILATLGALFINLEPALAAALADGFHLSTQLLGVVLAFESGASIAGGLAISALIQRFHARTLTLVALALYVVANLATAAASNVGALITLRAFAGIAEGALVGIAFAIISSSLTPHRLFALFGVLQTASAVVFFGVVAWLVHVYGWAAPFLLLAFFGVACIAAMPSAAGVLAVRRDDGRAMSTGGIIGIASIFIFFTAQAAIWPFLERLGAARGVGDVAIVGALSAGALSGLLGSIAVAALPTRAAGIRACAVGAALNVAAIFTLALAHASMPFFLGLCAFNFAWAVFAPLQLAVLKRADDAPRTFAVAAMATTAGFSAGPLLGGLLSVGSTDAAPFAVALGGTLVALASIRLAVGKTALAGF